MLWVQSTPLYSAALAHSVKCDCRSRGHELDPSLVPYFYGDEITSTAILPPFADLRRVAVIYKRRYVHKVLVILPRKKCGFVNWPSRHDHSCWLGHKPSNQTNSMKAVYSMKPTLYIIKQSQASNILQHKQFYSIKENTKPSTQPQAVYSIVHSKVYNIKHFSIPLYILQ